MADALQRFIFDRTDVRGLIVQLDNSYRDTLANHHYPPPVAELLGEFLSAAALLSATIKFAGRLTLQAQSEGEIPTIMAEASADGQLRGIARGAGRALSRSFASQLAGGRLAITIDPEKGQRYQGIVPLEGPRLAQCIDGYFAQSEQLNTRLWLAADGERAAGLLLQELPPQRSVGKPRQQQWEHLEHLANTIQPRELLQLEAETLLHRLFHREPLRLLDHRPLRFGCSCSRARCENALTSIGRDEAESILAERDSIDMGCEFCGRQYRFVAADVERLFSTLH